MSAAKKRQVEQDGEDSVKKVKTTDDDGENVEEEGVVVPPSLLLTSPAAAPSPASRPRVTDEVKMEASPESTVIMLYINCKVDGHYVKASVDLGARTTIMSQAAAWRCGLLGSLSAGSAGQVHKANIKIEQDYFPTSFSIVEDQPVDLRIGMDMLKKYQCNLDLGKNTLTLGTAGTETNFLTEDQPSARPAQRKVSERDGSKEEAAVKVKEEAAVKVKEEAAVEVEQATNSPVSVVEDTGSVLNLSSDKIGILSMAEKQGVVLFNSWDPRPGDSLRDSCPRSLRIIFTKFRPLMLLNSQDDLQGLLDLSNLGGLCSALVQLDPQAADLAGAALGVLFQRITGVTFLHRLLPVQERRGVDLMDNVKPLVLDMLRALMFSMLLSFRDSRVLECCLHRMTEPLRVEGEQDTETVSQYFTSQVVEGHTKHRCNLCNASNRKPNEAITHTLHAHFDWRKRCTTCNKMVKVNARGKAEEHNPSHLGKK